MQKLLRFFKQPWTKRGASALTALYGLLIVWLAWASYGYIMEYDNAGAAYAVYLFVSLLFGTLMIYSRKQLFTAILVLLLLPVNLVLVLLHWGQWFYILPSTVILIILFFAVRAHETLKVILGTIYLLMYVLSILAFIAFTTAFGDLNLHGFDINNRTEEVLSQEESYRYVRYVEPPDTVNRRVYIYVESNTEDVNFLVARFKKIHNARRVYAGRYEEELIIGWTSDDTLSINGALEKISFEEEQGNTDTSNTTSQPQSSDEEDVSEEAPESSDADTDTE